MSTLRIAAIGDSHFDATNRMDDNVIVHKAFIEQAREARVNLFLHGGDFYNARTKETERNAMEEILMACADEAPVFGVKGNHDVPGEVDVFNRLRGRHPIRVLDRPSVRAAGMITETNIACFGLPWFDKAHLVASLPADTPASETTERVVQLARGMLHSMRSYIASLGPKFVPVFVGHVLVAGSETSTGQTLVGTTVEISPADLRDLGCAHAHLAHIHKAQSWYDGAVAYSGSPQRHNFGENEPKGWNLVTIDTERWRTPGGVTVEFRELPARRIVLLETEFQGGVGGVSLTEDLNGALVRFRYRIAPEELHTVDEAAITLSLRNRGAHDVKLEAVLVHQDRVRCAEIVAAADSWEKVQAYWLAKSIDVPEANRARIRAKLDEIEQRDRSAAGVAA